MGLFKALGFALIAIPVAIVIGIIGLITTVISGSFTTLLGVFVATGLIVESMKPEDKE